MPSQALGGSLATRTWSSLLLWGLTWCVRTCGHVSLYVCSCTCVHVYVCMHTCVYMGCMPHTRVHVYISRVCTCVNVHLHVCPPLSLQHIPVHIRRTPEIQEVTGERTRSQGQGPLGPHKC